MTFWQIFVRVLPRRPLGALKSLWWHITGRRVRARNQIRAAGARLPFAYDAWIKGVERSGECAKQAASFAASWSTRPTFAFWLQGAGEGEGDIQRTITSFQNQVYPEWISIDRSELPKDLKTSDLQEISAADFIVPVKAGDEMSPLALYRFAEALRPEPDAALVYGDHDFLDDQGKRTNPWFKPEWNEEMFLATDFLSGAFALRSSVALATARNLAGQTSIDELLIVIARSGTSPIHVPHIVAHLRSHGGNAQPSRAEAVHRQLVAAGASATPGPFGTVRVSWPLPSEQPLVSIIIPTKDRVDLLRPCVESVLKRTTYEPLEVLIVDNGSAEGRTARYFNEISKDPRVRVVSCPGPYNYSRINNLAVGEAAGKYLCLLNNDTEVVTAGWLEELMRHAVRPECGAVGAKLLYPDHTIQHAGVIVGIGGAAGHAHRHLPDGDPGYFSHAHVSQFVSAVTAACLVVRKDKFEAVGGLDEDNLAVAFNDVDLCLKLERQGWRNIYVPHAVLIHHESKSRGKDTSPTQIDRYRGELSTFQKRWQAESYEDPSFNPNLDRTSETFLIRL